MGDFHAYCYRCHRRCLSLLSCTVSAAIASPLNVAAPASPPLAESPPALASECPSDTPIVSTPCPGHWVSAFACVRLASPADIHPPSCLRRFSCCDSLKQHLVENVVKEKIRVSSPFPARPAVKPSLHLNLVSSVGNHFVACLVFSAVLYYSEKKIFTPQSILIVVWTSQSSSRF